MRSNRNGAPLERLTLEEVRAYMTEHYADPLTNDELARLTGFSRSYFGEAYKRAYGQSVVDALTELRIGHAKRLLRDGDLLLKDIARQVGYSDEFYFSRRFKQEVGVTPSAYGKAGRRRAAAWSPETIGHLLPLGIVPAVAPLDPKWTPYYFECYQSLFEVCLNCSRTEQPEENIRLVMSAKPDVLVVQEMLGSETRGRLRNAGIELLEVEALSWKEQLREIAAAFGKEAACECWIQAYGARVEEARMGVSAAVGQDRFAVLRLSGEQLFLYSNKGIRDVLYKDLALPAVHGAEELVNETITLEQLRRLAPDRLLLLICPDADTRASWLSLQHQGDWRSLGAVQRGQVYHIPSSPWFEYSAISVSRMLDEAALMLTGKSTNQPPVPVHGRGETSVI